MIQIIPAVLSISEEDYARDISRYNQSLSLKDGWVHIDFMDNIFVPNKSISPSVIAKYPNDLHKEAHLMVTHPLEWINELVKAGFEKIIFHIESQDDPEKCIEYIKGEGLEVGLAINSETPIEKLEPFLNKIDIVLVMGVIPGFQGQKFNPDALEKIKLLKSKQLTAAIGIDGAIKDDNIKEAVSSGVDFVTVGSYLLKGNIEENLENLWEIIK